ncbi:uncharacterized protein KNAG_0B05625 [Huiozyma naganishii CBS 8797]|uniref:Uncharacterized protein n=1 Tax=Huiozyma naganishii (strain ATCC MYA-139 / BCRC 22969 / CBS 8797 / KCTC 17520 / NBRC 10181 / NCYC 3082 / Yp74L-3) TaxID=1071383 RepID=J7S409_HUIN7|nr:hypothetical protein KNAG_0B05625 [Kazachstania naganishii CBS 8797]CCK68994.1 hypothetical protein KNAG_0B05625 [Kazachstania naganishii CBS 8797]
MNNISRCLETGRQLRLTMEQAPDATSRRKAKGEYLLYKDRLMVKLHRVLDSLDMMDGRYASEVELFLRLVSEKKEVYRRLHGMDLRHGIPVRVQEKIAWLRCMETDKLSLGVRVNMKIGEVFDQHLKPLTNGVELSICCPHRFRYLQKVNPFFL